jgi:hypothetical protein
METLRDGSFMLTINAEALARGLRPSVRTARNKEYLVECIGAVGLDNVLQVIEDLETNRIDTGIIVDPFPYPQIFVFTNLLIVCSSTDIFEIFGGNLLHRLGPFPVGTLWTAVDFKESIYMSNGKVAVVRAPTSGVWYTTTDLPVATAICNFNSQVFTGSPNEPWI